MRHTLQFYTYPDGEALFMNKDEIVLRLTAMGAVNDCYVGDLYDGDQYCKRIQTKLKGRSAASILQFVSDRAISISYQFSADLADTWSGTECAVVDLRSQDGTLLTRYPYDNSNALREAIEFVMDQEEL